MDDILTQAQELKKLQETKRAELEAKLAAKCAELETAIANEPTPPQMDPLTWITLRAIGEITEEDTAVPVKAPKAKAKATPVVEEADDDAGDDEVEEDTAVPAGVDWLSNLDNLPEDSWELADETTAQANEDMGDEDFFERLESTVATGKNNDDWLSNFGS